MYEGKRIIGVAGLAAAISFGAVILATMVSCGALAAPASQTAAASPKTHELVTLLAQQWLEEQGVAKSTPVAPGQQTETSVEDALNSSAGATHGQIVALARAIPDLPDEFERPPASPRSTLTSISPSFSSASASSGTPIIT